VSDATGGAVDWLAEPHHDGAAIHVEPGTRSLGDTVAVRVRVPHGASFDRVLLRSTPDGEPRFVDAHVDRVDGTDTWWVAELQLVNPVTNYRFVLEGGRSATHLDAAGTWPHDVTDAADFRVTTHAPPPGWLADTIGYQIFPDRFARSGDQHAAPDWALAAEWDDPPFPDGRRAVRQWYGGDLGGIEHALDHLVGLGVNLVYLTPFFPAHSTHRYDATTFDHVDPLLGGDDSMVSLMRAARARGIRVIGDLTLNHTGRHHEWFERARADASAPEAGFYFFREHPDDYVAWYDIPSLPKLDHRSDELAWRLFEGSDSVVARWLRPPFELDGWRVDCANTTARHGDNDLNASVARSMRSAMAAHRPDSWLVAEHCYDATTDLDGSGWHGVMAYQWFTRPLAQWLGTVDPLTMMSPRPIPPLDGTTTARSMRMLAAGAPWSARTASMTMLDSHDTPRFRTLVGGDRTAHLVAMTALMTSPGVPTLFAGSEVGVTGGAMDSARVPFPWDRSVWDHETLEATRTLIALRRSSAALRHGGLRLVRTDAHTITYLRETSDERVLVHLARAGANEVVLAASRLAAGAAAATLVGSGVAVEGDRLVLPSGPGATVIRLNG
jgi:alpha-glucosidase